MLEKEQKLLTNKQTNFNLKGFLKLSISSIILSSTVYATNLIQSADFTKYPLPKELTAKSRGGNLPDKIAATDGIGSTILPAVGNDTSKLKNDAYNKVIYSNVKKLKDNETINDLITNGEITIDENTLNSINNSTFTLEHMDGELCDDGNPSTVNDVYTDGVCKGTLMSTYNELVDYINNPDNYVNGVLTLPPNGNYTVNEFIYDSNGFVGVFGDLNYDLINNNTIDFNNATININVAMPTTSDIYDRYFFINISVTTLNATFKNLNIVINNPNNATYSGTSLYACTGGYGSGDVYFKNWNLQYNGGPIEYDIYSNGFNWHFVNYQTNYKVGQNYINSGEIYGY